MPALCLMFSDTYYAQYDAGIIGLGLVRPPVGSDPRLLVLSFLKMLMYIVTDKIISHIQK